MVLPGWHDPALDFYKTLVDSDGRLTRREAATPRWISAKGGYGSNLGLWRSPARETFDTPADGRIAPLAAPAVPLIAVDPFFQIFSPRGKLNERTTVAGSDGKEQQISAIAFIGGRACQLVGPPVRGASAAEQLSVVVYPTRTVYKMLCDSTTAVTLTFMTPLLPSNLTIMARPASYLTFRATGTADVRVYVDISYQAAVAPKPNVTKHVACGANVTASGLGFGWLGNAATQQTPIPCRDPSAKTCWEPGNIDWGRLYLGSGGGKGVAVGAAEKLRAHFVSSGELADPDPCTSPLAGSELPVLATVLDVTHQSDAGAPASVVFAYDDEIAIRWWGTNFPGLWTRESETAVEMLAVAVADEGRVTALCKAFDDAEVDAYHRVGGPRYAAILSLAYRQAYASTKLAWNAAKQTHWQFIDEISTAGNLNTMDVIYPASPLFIRQSPDLAYNLLIPTLEYANNATNVSYNVPWAPHHLGKCESGNGLPPCTSADSDRCCHQTRSALSCPCTKSRCRSRRLPTYI